jgi:hypothetical protein
VTCILAIFNAHAYADQNSPLKWISKKHWLTSDVNGFPIFRRRKDVLLLQLVMMIGGEDFMMIILESNQFGWGGGTQPSFYFIFYFTVITAISIIIFFLIQRFILTWGRGQTCFTFVKANLVKPWFNIRIPGQSFSSMQLYFTILTLWFIQKEGKAVGSKVIQLTVDPSNPSNMSIYFSYTFNGLYSQRHAAISSVILITLLDIYQNKAHEV